MMFRLISPWWLLSLLFAGPLAFTSWRLWIHRVDRLRLGWLRKLGIILLLLGIALRPSLPGGASPQGLTNFDVYFVVDTTGSMVAEDYNGSKPRLEGVKQDIKDITTQMAGARFTVITFASQTYVELPLTTDASAIASVADTLQPEITVYANGSSISQPLATLKTTLQKAHQAKPGRQALVYFMSDGEQTSSQKIASFSSLQPLVSGGAVLGYGTATGGKMKEFLGYDTDTKPEYIQDYSQNSDGQAADAISKINETNLQTIASQLHIPYLHRTQPGGVQTVTKRASQGAIAMAPKSQSGNTSTSRDGYWLLALPLVVLALCELWALRHMLADIRPTGRSGGGRP